MKIIRRLLSKSEFLTVLASEDVQEKTSSEVNIKNGYRKCAQEDILEKCKITNQSRKQNVSTVCDDDHEENEDNWSCGFDKDSEFSESNKSNNDEEDYENTCQLSSLINELQGLIYLKNVQGKLNPAFSEKQIHGSFFGGIFYADIHKRFLCKKKPNLFVDKLLR